MGIYLSEPKKEKHTDVGGNAKYEFAASSMQGWRMSMEDAHIAQVDIDNDTHIFGVFDGHGGKEVAIFVSKHFIPELKASQVIFLFNLLIIINYNYYLDIYIYY